jgi:DNA-binding Xre family transcriptional regulator
MGACTYILALNFRPNHYFLHFIAFFNNNINNNLCNLHRNMPRHRSSLEEYLVAVGDKIRRTRIQRGYTLEEVGRDIGLDKSNMYRIEQGRNITLLTLLKIAVVLEVDPNDLIKNNVEVELSDLEKFLRAKQRRRAS